MEILSKLFGKIEYSEENIIRFDEGLIGIPDKKNFILIEKEDFKPFSYLQSVDDPSFILIVINPLMVEKDYRYDIHKGDMEALDIKDENDFSLLAIVIFAKRVEDITVNLRAPVLFNIHTKKALQVILLNDDYSAEEPLIRPISAASNTDGADIFKKG
ncbi:MAG: flagellar assembly factor FliW [Acidobacteriota bacterium]|nr:flagellar assembly factor FliW [Acidobacteriota bacterium]